MQLTGRHVTERFVRHEYATVHLLARIEQPTVLIFLVQGYLL
jgi:hypothetical protein